MWGGQGEGGVRRQGDGERERKKREEGRRGREKEGERLRKREREKRRKLSEAIYIFLAASRHRGGTVNVVAIYLSKYR